MFRIALQVTQVLTEFNIRIIHLKDDQARSAALTEREQLQLLLGGRDIKKISSENYQDQDNLSIDLD